jgi:hypothetical protein
MSSPVAEAPDATGYRPAGWLWLSVSVFLSSFAWAAHLGLRYLVIPEVCALDAVWILHAISVVCFTTAGAGLFSAWRLRRHADPHRLADRYARRDAYLGWIGVAKAVFFAMVILAEVVPALFIHPCS